MKSLDQFLGESNGGASGWNVSARRAVLKQRQKDMLNAFKERAKAKIDAAKEREAKRKEAEDKRKAAEQERKARVAERERMKKEIKKELEAEKNGDSD